MKELIDWQAHGVTVDPELDKYQDIVMFPKKLVRANEMIAKWGIPKAWEEEILAEERSKQAVWVKGILSQADVDTNTFIIVVEATNNQLKTKYTITALSDIVKKLVKDYWGDVIKVCIKPKNQKKKPLEYELLEVG